MIVVALVLILLLDVAIWAETKTRRLQGEIHDLKIYRLQQELADLRAKTGLTYVDPDWPPS